MVEKRHAFSAKNRIDHRVYGTGTVVEVNERHTTIQFDEAGRKKFVTRLVELTSSDTLPPAKPARKRKSKASR